MLVNTKGSRIINNNYPDIVNNENYTLLGGNEMETSLFLNILFEMVDLIINPNEYSGNVREELINKTLLLKTVWDDAEADWLQLNLMIDQYRSRYGNIEE